MDMVGAEVPSPTETVVATEVNSELEEWAAAEVPSPSETWVATEVPSPSEKWVATEVPSPSETWVATEMPSPSETWVTADVQTAAAALPGPSPSSPEIDTEVQWALPAAVQSQDGVNAAAAHVAELHTESLQSVITPCDEMQLSQITPELDARAAASAVHDVKTLSSKASSGAALVTMLLVTSALPEPPPSPQGLLLPRSYLT